MSVCAGDGVKGMVCVYRKHEVVPLGLDTHGERDTVHELILQDLSPSISAIASSSRTKRNTHHNRIRVPNSCLHQPLRVLRAPRRHYLQPRNTPIPSLYPLVSLNPPIARTSSFNEPSNPANAAPPPPQRTHSAHGT